MSRVARLTVGSLLTRANSNNVQRMHFSLNSRNLAAVAAPKERVTATLIPGDGVGPEMVNAVEEVFKAAGVPMDFEVFFLSEVHPAQSVPVSTVVESIARNGLCLKGILQTPAYATEGMEPFNIQMRKELDLYANVIKVTSIPGVACKHHNVDLVVIREQTEGEYSCLEHESVEGVVECLKVVTAEKSYRIAKFAFDYATKFNRKKVTAVHKANIMKLGDGLFLRCCEEISRLYPNIEFERMIVDNACMQMVSKPQQFDVLVMPNLYGNIIANVATGLVGGAGLVAGEGYSKNAVVFEPGARHSFSEAVGKNVANPTALLFCAANLLDHASLHFYGKMVRESVYKVLKAGKVKTQDLGGYATTKQFTKAVIQNLKH